MIDTRDIARARDAMVDDLVARRIIKTPSVERAFRRVARDEFLPRPFLLPNDPLLTGVAATDDPRRVYADTLVVLKREKLINSGTPSVVAAQIELLCLLEGMRVLHVGTGSGYYTAILAEIVGERGSVIGVEFEPDLAALSASFLARAGYTNVTVQHGDGARGVPEAAPFDRILASAGAADIVPAWVEQLDDGGRIVLPFCQISQLAPRVTGGVLLSVEKAGGDLMGSFSSMSVLFVGMQGVLAPQADEGAFFDAVQRWFALEDFLRVQLPIRIVLKSAAAGRTVPAGVFWSHETPNALMWIEPE